jgi:predicted alpha/beta-fold hydrolase
MHARAGARLAAAMVVSSPFCPASSNARLSRAWTLPWVYNVALTRLFIRRFCAEHAAALGQHPALDLPKLMQVRPC